MARKNPRVRPTPEVRSANPQRRNGQRTSPGEARVERAEAMREAGDFIREAMDAARGGDDSLLLPYQPTPSINPPRPRTLAAGYDPDTQTLRIRFRDGAGYEYYDVPERVWRNFKRVKSPGRAINRTLNNYDYSPADW